MKKTRFQPDVHGFAFANSWSFEPSELNQMNDTLHHSVGGAIGSLSSSLASLGKTLIEPVMNNFVGAAEPIHYGLCGGMAFAALDYYKLGKQIPRGKDEQDQPRREDASGKVLRDYLWRRQLESMGGNFPGLLSWMTMLHMGFMTGGGGWLLERTKEEWANLKQHVDQDEPWPICLIGNTQNPFYNHQVLAYGYDDPGDGTGVLYLYDMNCPNREHKTLLDFRGSELAAQESCSDTRRGPLKGFFCEHYTNAQPPELVDF